jgi:probable rRNA maturation factor
MGLNSLRRTAAFVCRRRGVHHAEISIAVVNDAIIRRLKKQYFGESRTTDVISFDLNGLGPKKKRAKGPLEAEIIINAQQADRMARRLKVSSGKELHLYLIHGLLHVMGFDDQTPAQARIMHRREQEYLMDLEKGMQEKRKRRIVKITGISE